MRALVSLLLSVILSLAAGSFPAMAETRIALVVGNSAYRGLEPLRNPGNDARDVSAMLEGLGFRVTTLIDADRAGLRKAMATFVQDAATADASLFYYAGHGLQLASRNYLVPVDAELRSEADVIERTVPLDEVMRVQPGSGGIRLIFLDACQNNPIPNSRSERPAGLARVGTEADFFVSFATQPDNVAFDGAGRNSPFAQAVLAHLPTVGADINATMIEVRKDVRAATGGAQTPYENSSLTRQFYFAPGEPPATTPETQLWQLAASQRDADLLRIYLERFPEGAHTRDVQALLETSRKTAPAQPANASKDVEELLWSLARTGRARALVDLYLARYPDGANVAEAQRLAESLTDDRLTGAPPGVVCEKLATHPRDSTANTPGVEFASLAERADAAVEACEAAVRQHPEAAHFVALLARATMAQGRRPDGIRLFREAAERGDMRAMVSLGLLMESGDGVPLDLAGAYSLYEKAAERGSADGAINLAVAMMGGRGIARDTPRAVALLQQAAAAGSAIATYNLGVLAQDGVTGKPADALDLFRGAARLGDPRGHLAAAILLDEGRGVPKDAEAAATELLRGVSADSGEAATEITGRAGTWSRDTLRAVQERLKEAGYYKGSTNGRVDPSMKAALQQWRLLGPRAGS